MAVTFGCPLVGKYDELCGKHLKVGQRAYATDGQSPDHVHEGTNWKTGAVDENGNLMVYERLPWDTNMGGDNEVNPSNYYTKEQVDDIVKDAKDIFTFTCDVKENSDIAGGFEVVTMTATSDEIKNAYEKRKTIKAIGNTWDNRTFILDLVGFVNETFIFSGVSNDVLLTLFLNSNTVEIYVRQLQFGSNMIQTIERNENVETCYPSVKAVADYVAKYGGGDVVIPIISWDEANELLSTGIYRIDNGNATSILISSLLEQQARQVLITGDEFSSRHKTKNIETNEWGDWSDWNYFTTSEDFQNAINFVNETLANYYTKEEVDEKDGDIRATAEFALGQVTNFQYDLDLKENVSNKIDNIINYDKVTANGEYPTAVAVIDFVDNQFMHSMATIYEVFATKEEIGDIAEAIAAIIALQNKYIGGETA